MRKLIKLETKKTCLGPTYGFPINKLQVVKGNSDKDYYLAYSTQEKVNLKLFNNILDCWFNHEFKVRSV